MRMARACSVVYSCAHLCWLKNTKIGLCVNTLRKQSKSPSVQTAAKELVNKWMAYGTPVPPPFYADHLLLCTL